MTKPFLSDRLEEALRFAAECHDGQLRRGSGTPYFEHVAAVALILDRAGFDEDTVIAGLLHDIIEDTSATAEAVANRFGLAIAETVRQCSEVKVDDAGNKRPWIDRKREHLAALGQAPLAARAVVLADKLHNLLSILLDLRLGCDVWSRFHAERGQVLWYYRRAIETCGRDDPRLVRLAGDCEDLLERLGQMERANGISGTADPSDSPGLRSGGA
jgi:(p)ppGpp synthase/HD superfamily hydrolase